MTDRPPRATVPLLRAAPFGVLDALVAHARAGLLAQALGALILAFGYFRGAPAWACASWGLGWLLVCGLRWRAVQLYRLRPRAPDERRAGRAWDTANLAGGALWGLAALLFYAGTDVPQQIGLTVLVCALCLVLPASRYPVYLATAGLGFAPLIADIVADGAPHGLALAAVLVLVYLSAAWVASSYRLAFRRLFEAMARAEALAQQLAAEKKRADAARAQAEEATAGRSRFYTAASHDLRQPLQALLMLAGALERQVLPGDAGALATQLGASVRALEGLFDALLDIGQLEAGAVQVRRRAVQLEAVYQRVALHWRPIAFDRGLSLDFRGGERWVDADPVLLERILRNLVGNAVQCTRDGGVLVTCRPADAMQWKLQVWDTGPGIPAAMLPHIFDEFFRGNTSSVRGLGLGLTIAQGLAKLQGSTLAVRSTPGRGTVFSLALPRAVAAPPVADDPARALATLAGRRFLVATDHLPQAPQVVDQLRGWQAQVLPVDDLASGRWDEGAAPGALVIGPAPLALQQAVLARWQRAWPAAPAVALLIAPAAHPAVAWPRLVRLTQPLAAHRLRAALLALDPAGARGHAGGEPD